MPRSIEKHLTKDLLETLDAAVEDVEYSRSGKYLKLYTDEFSKYASFTEQDLVTLLEFLRKSKEEDK